MDFQGLYQKHRLDTMEQRECESTDVIVSFHDWAFQVLE